MNKPGALIAFVFTALGALVLWIASEPIIKAAGRVALPIMVFVGAAVTLTMFGIGSMLVWQQYESAKERRAKRKVVNAKEQLLLAQAHKTRQQSDFIITAAPAGSQVYLSNLIDDVTKPLHLNPALWVNGSPGQISVDELQRWAAFNALHATARRPELAAPEPAAPAVSPLLPVLASAQRLLLVGASDSGKSTLLKHLITARLQTGQVIVIDPHSPSKILGVDVIGAGRDYVAIGQALASLVYLMTERYSQIARGEVATGQHDRLTVIIDEWTGIARNIKDAGELLAQLLVESRKAQIHMVVATHSDNVKTLGIDGEGQLRASFTVCRLFGGNGQPRRAFIDPTTKLGPNGEKLEPVEYSLPGPFEGYPRAGAGQVISSLPAAPTSEEYKVIDLLRQGASSYAICKELGWTRGESAYRRIEAIQQQFVTF